MSLVVGPPAVSDAPLRPKRNRSKCQRIERMFGRVSGVAEQGITSTEIPLEPLEAQICEGAGHLAAGVGRWLLLVGEFDRRKGYERWECRSGTDAASPRNS